MKTITFYNYTDLDKETKELVCEKNKNWYTENDDWYKPACEAFGEMLEDAGYLEPEIFFRYSCSQGDGAMFEFKNIEFLKIWNQNKYPLSDKLREAITNRDIVIVMSGKHSGHYYHEYSVTFDFEIYPTQYQDVSKETKLLLEELANYDIEEIIAYDYRTWCSKIYHDLYHEMEYFQSFEFLDQLFEDNSPSFLFNIEGKMVSV